MQHKSLLERRPKPVRNQRLRSRTHTSNSAPCRLNSLNRKLLQNRQKTGRSDWFEESTNSNIRFLSVQRNLPRRLAMRIPANHCEMRLKTCPSRRQNSTQNSTPTVSNCPPFVNKLKTMNAGFMFSKNKSLRLGNDTPVLKQRCCSLMRKSNPTQQNLQPLNQRRKQVDAERRRTEPALPLMRHAKPKSKPNCGNSWVSAAKSYESWAT